MLLPQIRNCRACNLHQGDLIHRGIPSRCYVKGNGTHCVLFLGEAPGRQEDEQGTCFVGASGRLLHKWVEQLPSFVDVYFGNAVRCHPPHNEDPTSGQLLACRSFLLEDLLRLRGEYGESNVYVIALGAIATRALRGCTLKQSFRLQGDKLTAPFPSMICFHTFHPARLFRVPEEAHAVAGHLDLIRNHLDGISREEENSQAYQVHVAAPVDMQSPLISVDIETYGLVESFPVQTVFHPRKSVILDGISQEDLIKDYTLSWMKYRLYRKECNP